VTKADFEDIKRWVQYQRIKYLTELSNLRKRIFELEKEIEETKDKKRALTLKSVLFTLKENEGEYLQKLAALDTIEKKANEYLEILFPEIPTLG
jgi:predicted  nucleic acid-binding Zn-ribbon protein